jgi:hypothetical protein
MSARRLAAGVAAAAGNTPMPLVVQRCSFACPFLGQRVSSAQGRRYIEQTQGLSGRVAMYDAVHPSLRHRGLWILHAELQAVGPRLHARWPGHCCGPYRRFAAPPDEPTPFPGPSAGLLRRRYSRGRIVRIFATVECAVCVHCKRNDAVGMI